MDDQTRPALQIRTIVCQALTAGDDPTRAIVPPIHLSATFLRDADNGYSSGCVYGRPDSASVCQVEELMAALEGADAALAFGSGSAAAAAVILAFETPTHVVASEAMYWGLRSWLRSIGRYGHSVTFVDTTDPRKVEEAVRPGQTGLLWIETPSNPLWTLTDIAAMAEIAHKGDALLCVDSTVSTPVITRPIAHGADLVVHSATKYLNGHSDVVAGMLVTAAVSPFWNSIKDVRAQLGATLAPFESWLLMRGMRTLDLRVREQASTAAILARRLVEHPAVSAVLYPGLATHPGHEIALRQMKNGFGGMLSLRLKGGEAAAIAAAAKVRVWKRATSLGGVESLIEHRSSIEGSGTRCPTDLLRLSVGLEDPDDLFRDLSDALDSSARECSPFMGLSSRS